MEIAVLQLLMIVQISCETKIGLYFDVVGDIIHMIIKKKKEREALWQKPENIFPARKNWV